MTIRDLLSASGSGPIIVDKQTFPASGTWTKPAGVLPTDLVVADLWGGGGSGGIRAQATDQDTGGPGAGGGHNRAEIRAGDLNATEAVVVGAGGAPGFSTGGAANGSMGGTSSFKGYQAFGGGGGAAWANDNNNFPSGGGTLSAGAGLTGSNRVLGGRPQTLAQRDDAVVNTSFQDTNVLTWTPGEWGGGSYNAGAQLDYLQPIHGGAAGNTSTASIKWRSSVWGGAAGGGYANSIGIGSAIGGVSQFGGNGGSVPIPASNTSNVNGVAGSPRGGGGSGAKWGSTGTVSSGAGGRGEVVITIYRGI